MNTTKLASAAVLALALSTAAHAVHLDPGGRGQVLIYPYYTVNKQQQTLVSVTNTSTVAQAVKVHFNEGYNGRYLLDFNVFLSPFDSWTGTIFALRDAGIDSDGAAVISSDTSCTAPLFSEDATSLNGRPYVAFRDFLFEEGSAFDDGGPYGLGRTREGYIEIYAMADVAAPLSAAIAHGSNGSAPTGCAQVRTLLPDNVALSTPTGGLMGSVGIIDVAQGTYLSARAEALAGFTGSKIFTPPDNISPYLGDVNDGVGPLATRATARIFDANGKVQTLTYPGADARSRRVDAVSAVFMADHVYNEYQIAANLGAASEWLVTLPTKPLYTDPLYIDSNAIPPFLSTYQGDGSGTYRYSRARFSRVFYSRNGQAYSGECSNPFFCGSPPPPSLSRTVNVLPIVGNAVIESPVLGSTLVSHVNVGPVTGPPADSGWMDVRLYLPYSDPHALLPSAEGKVLRGLPVIGFWASNIVNNNVSNGVLANYAAAVRHATSVTCVKASDSTPCD